MSLRSLGIECCCDDVHEVGLIADIVASVRPFLTAEWRYLVILTWRVDPTLLLPYLPAGVELDLRGGAAFASFVAFEFRRTRVRGVRVPFHVNFPEINLRFYVKAGGHRGVVFIRELVPRYLIALVARRFYNEPYSSMPMRARARHEGEQVLVEHCFGRDLRHRLSAAAGTTSEMPSNDSDAYYFKEHRWGFGRTRDGQPVFFEVNHVQWPIYPVIDHQLEVDFARLYGPEWAFLGREPPWLRLLADGSAIEVLPPRPLAELAARARIPSPLARATH